MRASRHHELRRRHSCRHARHESPHAVLPLENDLCRKLDFRAKYITDTENKFKYLFRETSPEQLVLLNFHGDTRM